MKLKTKMLLAFGAAVVVTSSSGRRLPEVHASGQTLRVRPFVRPALEEVYLPVARSGPNRAPTVSAGPELTVTLPERATLAGSVSDDGTPHPVEVRWSQLSGSGVAAFADSVMASTRAAFSEPGTYVLELTATDGERLSSDSTTIVVHAPEPSRLLRVPQDHPTIQAAIDAAGDGDTVLVSPGTYEEETLVLAGKAITLASWFLTTRDVSLIEGTILDGGRATVIDVRDSVGPSTRIIGFTIRNGNDGISAKGRLEILNNRFMGNKDAIDYERGGGICRDNLFQGNSDDAIDLDGPTAVLIEHNVIRDSGDDGIEIRLHPYSGPVLQVEVRHNTVSNNGEDGIQIIGYPDRSDRSFVIERNLIEANKMVGLGFMDDGRTKEDFRAASVREPVRLLHNTFRGNACGLTGGDNLIAINNIFSDSSRVGLKGANGESVAAYNLFWNNGEDAQDSNLVEETTLFSDPRLDDRLRPGSESAAIDAGAESFEWRGAVEPVVHEESHSGTAPDIGAIETNFTVPARTRSGSRKRHNR